VVEVIAGGLALDRGDHVPLEDAPQSGVWFGHV
jgi:hypothetical protein